MLALAWQAISRCCQNCRITQLKRPLGPHPLHLLNAHIAAIFSLLLLSSKCAEAAPLFIVYILNFIRMEVSHQQQFLSLMKIIPYILYFHHYSIIIMMFVFALFFQLELTKWDPGFEPGQSLSGSLAQVELWSCGHWSCLLFHHPNKQSRSHLDFVIKQLLVGLSEQNYLAFVVLTTLMSLVSKLAELRRS